MICLLSIECGKDSNLKQKATANIGFTKWRVKKKYKFCILYFAIAIFDFIKFKK